MLFASLLCAIFAGIMNGAYPLALRYIRLPENTTWLMFSVFTFLMAPWITLFLLNSHFLAILPLISMREIIILSLGGFSFGIGMILFTFSLRFIGIAVTFSLNIAVGTVIGSLLPILILQPAKLMTIVGLVQLLGLCCFLGGICNAVIAANYRDAAFGQSNQYKGKNFIGVFLGILPGLFTSAQGFVYSYVLPSLVQLPVLQGHALLASTLPWLFIFNAAWVPYVIFFVNKNLREDSFKEFKQFFKGDFIFLILMAVFYFGSIVLFSEAANLLGNMGSVIAWPIFMIFIILTATVSGFIQKEWEGAGQTALCYEFLSIGFMVVAVIVLAFDGYLNLNH